MGVLGGTVAFWVNFQTPFDTVVYVGLRVDYAVAQGLVVFQGVSELVVLWDDFVAMIRDQGTLCRSCVRCVTDLDLCHRLIGCNRLVMSSS